MYFEDLVPYTYFKMPLSREVKSIGWLDDRHEFARGVIDGRVVEILERCYWRFRANQTRGIHQCPFCDSFEQHTVVNGTRSWNGSCELWVPGLTDQDPVYAAPGLIIHYIRDHQYMPPAEFVAAVLAFESRDQAWAPASVGAD